MSRRKPIEVMSDRELLNVVRGLEVAAAVNLADVEKAVKEIEHYAQVMRAVMAEWMTRRESPEVSDAQTDE